MGPRTNPCRPIQRKGNSDIAMAFGNDQLHTKQVRLFYDNKCKHIAVRTNELDGGAGAEVQDNGESCGQDYCKDEAFPPRKAIPIEYRGQKYLCIRLELD